MNAQDPLSQLRDIHLADSIQAWPPAIGWWLLVIFILIITAWACYKFVKFRARNLWRKQALQELRDLQINYPNISKADTHEVANANAQISALLRRALYQVHANDKILSESTNDWVKRLEIDLPFLSNQELIEAFFKLLLK